MFVRQELLVKQQHAHTRLRLIFTALVLTNYMFVVEFVGVQLSTNDSST